MICYDIFIIQYQPTGLLMVKFLLAHVCLEHYFQIVCGNIRIIDIDFQNCRFPSTNAIANQDLVTLFEPVQLDKTKKNQFVIYLLRPFDTHLQGCWLNEAGISRVEKWMYTPIR